MIENVPDEHKFHFTDGKKAHNILDLARSIRDMDPDVFAHHVTNNNNDFANWIADCLHDSLLASKVMMAHAQKEIVQVLDEEIAEKSAHGEELTSFSDQGVPVTNSPAKESSPQPSGNFFKQSAQSQPITKETETPVSQPTTVSSPPPAVFSERSQQKEKKSFFSLRKKPALEPVSQEQNRQLAQEEKSQETKLPEQKEAPVQDDAPQEAKLPTEQLAFQFQESMQQPTQQSSSEQSSDKTTAAVQETPVRDKQFFWKEFFYGFAIGAILAVIIVLLLYQYSIIFP
ncbi:MAG: hypothetical protein H6502_04000 [Candidatus Woesearchaeota archaeon]|nr:MAG: hypothetical protein H6502_04000 [Candidatus Woesearchaeota archaeon]